MMTRILIADDDDDLRQALAQLLELEGYLIAGAPDTTAALVMARQTPYDLILLDVLMPGTSGMDMLGQLHGVLPAVPIIMMSGQTSQHTVTNALRAGACDFIVKPFDDEHVLLTVKRALSLVN